MRISHEGTTESRLPFGRLRRTDKLKTAWEILRAQAQIIFSRKFVWFIAGILTFFVIVYIGNYNEGLDDRITQDGILPLLLEFPLVVLAVFFNMQLIAGEKDNRTLEILFTTAGSRYKVWVLRMGTVNLMLLLIALLLSTLSFFAIADIDLLATAVHGWVPAFFIGALTFYFSVLFRSGFGAGMVSAILLILIFMFHDALDDTKYILFFNPFDVPRRVDPETWSLWMWQNRIFLILAGLSLQFFALRGMENRERLLR
jgi:ABC-type transport system involved in multi-copper enzyme maturation permease subunit